MIHKSMSRKTASFGQLYAYLSREASDPDYTIHHNLYGQTPFEVVADFEVNAALLKARRNGVVLYHEILSVLRAKGIPEERQKAILKDIAMEFIKVRAPDNLAVCFLHDDKAGHLHCHFMISANAAGSIERLRWSKQAFTAMRVDFERRMIARYPEMEQSITMGKRAGKALSKDGGELKRRTGMTPKRQSVEERLKAILDTATDKAECLARMQAAGLEFYRRGTTVGVRDTVSGRKHRLTTIGLMPEFLALSARIEVSERKALADRTAKAAQQTPQVRTALAQAMPAPGVQRSPSHIATPKQEADMNILDSLMQGVSAIVDLATVTPSTLDPVTKKPGDPKAAHATSGASTEHDSDRIARERQAELEAIADEQSQERTLKR